MEIQQGSFETHPFFCNTCPYGSNREIFFVPDYGNLNADVLLIGEAPGKDEALSKRPFIGPTGKLLDDILKGTKWNRLELYIANVVGCQPPKQEGGSARPSDGAIECCKWRLYHSIASVQPKLIVAMGNVAIKALFDHEGITEFRGQNYFWEPDESILKVFPTIPKRIKVVPTFHPAYLLRNWEAIKYGLRDFRRAHIALETPNEIPPEPEITHYICQTMEHVDFLMTKLMESKDYVFDCETSDLSWEKGEVLCWSFSWNSEGWVLPFNSIHQTLWTDTERREILGRLQVPFISSEVRKTAQNIIFDWQFLLNYGIDLEGPFDDTMQIANLVDENVGIGLDDLAEFWTSWSKYSHQVRKFLPNKNASYTLIPDQNLWHYAAKDAIVTRTVKTLLSEELDKQKLRPVYEELVLPLCELIVDSTRYGAYINKDRVVQLAQELKIEIAKSEREMFDIVGYEFNPRSTKQLQEVLFDKLQLKRGKKTKTGYSTDVTVLENLAKGHRVPEIMLKIREINKQIGTYLTGSATGKKQTGMAKHIDDNNRIHTEFLPHGARTGRISSRSPNLENIPRESIIRKLFAAPPSKKLLIADYKQCELWMMAFRAKDNNLLHDLRTGDIHDTTARNVFDLSKEMIITDEQRVKAKGVNFGVVYGRGPWSLAQKLGMSLQDATRLLKKWFDRYYNVASWIKLQHYEAKTKGYVTTFTGRRRHLYGLKYLSDDKEQSFMRGEIERQAQNSPIQGGAGEYLLLAAIDVKKELYPLKPKVIHDWDIVQTNYVHDCDILEVNEDKVWDYYFKLEEILERRRHGVRIPVEIFICDYWSQEKDPEFKAQFKEEHKQECERRGIPHEKDLTQYGW